MHMPAPKQSPTSADALEHSEFLGTCLAWQESLLQSYRNYLLVTQSIFLAVNVGLLSAQASANTTAEKLVFGLPFITIAIIGMATLAFLSGAVRERAKAVDWWQRRILRHEKSHSGFRSFTTYRVAKEHGFKAPAVEAQALEEDEIDRLLRLETPKARKVFGIFVPGFAVLWIVLVGCAVLNVLAATPGK
jgi:hypothetical protein